jgi:hypothetical protein
MRISISCNNQGLYQHAYEVLSSIPKVKVVSGRADLILAIRNIDYLLRRPILSLLDEIDEQGAIGGLYEIDCNLLIGEYFCPKPQPEFYAKQIPESYFVFMNPRVNKTVEECFRDYNYPIYRQQVGIRKQLQEVKVNSFERNLSLEDGNEIKGRVDILIPTALRRIGGEVLLFRLLDSLDFMDRMDIGQVIVIVDRLTEQKIEYPNHPKLKFVDFRSTFNYSEKLSAGLPYSNSEFLIILNDDMLAISPDWLEKTKKTLADPTVGVVGALLKYPDGRIQHAGISIHKNSPIHAFYGFSVDDPAFLRLPSKYEVSAVTGAFMGIRRSIWDKFSGMNYMFEVNFGDIDLCFRLRQSGLRCIQNNDIVFEHLESATRNKKIVPKEIPLLKLIWNDFLHSDDFLSADAIRREEPNVFQKILIYYRIHGFFKLLRKIFLTK